MVCTCVVRVLGTEARHHPHTLSINPEEKVQEVVLAGRGKWKHVRTSSCPLLPGLRP
jgi:hypothetical protein